MDIHETWIMSIALGSSTSSSSSRIQSPRFLRGMSSFYPVVGSPDPAVNLSPAGDNPFTTAAMTFCCKEEAAASFSCSSSIGRSSDSSLGASQSDEGDGEAEVQSSYKGPLDTMDALEESLPIRKGISKFYSGKSKSFTSLGDAASVSAKDLAKPENPYNRKRKNVLAFNSFFERRQSDLKHSTGCITKKLANSTRCAALLAGNMSSSESNTSDENGSPCRPPLYPKARPLDFSASAHQLTFPSRSFSLIDLQSASTSSSTDLE